MEYKEDLRIQKTRKVLRNAILELLKEKPLDDISVIEICNKAMVNRMTFYKYYEDKYVLLDDAFNEIKDNITSKIPNNPIASMDEASKHYVGIIEIIIDYIENNKELVLAIEKNTNAKLLNIITNVFEGGIIELLKEIDKIRPLKYSISVTSSFLYGGFIYALSYLMHHPKEFDKKQFRSLINDLKNNIFKIDFLYK